MRPHLCTWYSMFSSILSFFICYLLLLLWVSCMVSFTHEDLHKFCTHLQAVKPWTKLKEEQKHTWCCSFIIPSYIGWKIMILKIFDLIWICIFNVLGEQLFFRKWNIFKSLFDIINFLQYIGRNMPRSLIVNTHFYHVANPLTPPPPHYPPSPPSPFPINSDQFWSPSACIFHIMKFINSPIKLWIGAK